MRPGPIQGGAVHPYIERRKGLREDPDYEVPYEHPSLEPVLRDTLGAIVFQDQVIEVAMAFAGFSAGEAEGLRRAMSRKRSEAAMRAYEAQVRRGGDGARRPREVAERVYEQIVGFSGFGFPKSHSAAFGLLAYQSTWLRVHYGPEFLCALLNEQPMGFYPPDALVHEAQRRGIEVLPPCVGRSGRGVQRRGRRLSASGSATWAACARRTSGARGGARAGGAFHSVADLASRCGACASPRSSGWHGRGAATRWSTPGRGAPAPGAVAARRGRAGRRGTTSRAPSSRCRWSPPRAARCAS